MTIPDFQTIMLPLLLHAKDGEPHNIHDAINNLADHFKLSEEERSVLLPSGQQPIFDNRVGWAKTYMKKAGLLEGPTRGYFQITAKGKEVLNSNPSRIDKKFLMQFEEFQSFQERSHGGGDGNGRSDDLIYELTPEETLESSYQKIRSDLSEKLLEYAYKSTPGFFEKLVIDILVNMGYGGSRRDAARAVGQRGDEGIDGIIDEDKLGLDTIYIQAKKWDTSSKIGRPEIQKFVGALTGKRARRGIYLTTANFSKEAWDYAANIDLKVILIDGKKLTDLMIDYGVGVTTRSTYELKDLDSDYFGENT